MERGATVGFMVTMAVRGRVTAGRLIVDEPVELPDNMNVELVVTGGNDDLDEPERLRLHDAIRHGQEQIERGESAPLDDVLAELSAG
jgi:hypothetical protein